MVSQQTQYQRWNVLLMRNILSQVPPARANKVCAMLKAVFAQENDSVKRWIC